jgi:hypothetical protein
MEANVLKRIMLAIAVLFMLGFAFAPREAYANYMGIAAGLAQAVPAQDVENARWVCRRGYYGRRRCFRVRPYYRRFYRPRRFYYRRFYRPRVYVRPYRRFYRY